MRTTLLVLLFLASAASASESVWKWIDGDGVTHFSDRPVPGATKVELRSINQINSAGASTPSTTTDAPPAPAADSYSAFEVSAPAPEQAFINTGGEVSITLRVDPGLRPGHTVSVLLDGQLVSGSPGSGLRYTAKDVPRGEHTVTAVIKDQSNQPVASATGVRFYVRQPIAKDSPNGANGASGAPNPRPTPNPPLNPNSPMRPSRR